MRPATGAFTFRELHTHAEYAECVAIQRETWGATFTENVPASMLMIPQKVGGITAGAFAADGRMVGFVYGLTGIREGKLVHWSHMLAVRDEARGTGLGQALKWYQRKLLLKLGVELMFWTFDPLVSRNAHLNLNRLGAEVHAYVPDYYGADSDSELHSGLGTDRFIAMWRLKGPRVRRAMAEKAGDIGGKQRRETSAGAAGAAGAADRRYAKYANAPLVAPSAGDDLPDVKAVRIEVPADIQMVKRRNADEAWQWRTVTRRAFLHYLGKGYHVEGIFGDPDGRSFYALSAHPPVRSSAPRRRGRP